MFTYPMLLQSRLPCIQRSAKKLFLRCVTRPHAQRQVTQPMKGVLADLWMVVETFRTLHTASPRRWRAACSTAWTSSSTSTSSGWGKSCPRETLHRRRPRSGPTLTCAGSTTPGSSCSVCGGDWVWSRWKAYLIQHRSTTYFGWHTLKSLISFQEKAVHGNIALWLTMYRNAGKYVG